MENHKFSSINRTFHPFSLPSKFNYNPVLCPVLAVFRYESHPVSQSKSSEICNFAIFCRASASLLSVGQDDINGQQIYWKPRRCCWTCHGQYRFFSLAEQSNILISSPSCVLCRSRDLNFSSSTVVGHPPARHPGSYCVTVHPHETAATALHPLCSHSPNL